MPLQPSGLPILPAPRAGQPVQPRLPAQDRWLPLASSAAVPPPLDGFGFQVGISASSRTLSRTIIGRSLAKDETTMEITIELTDSLERPPMKRLCNSPHCCEEVHRYIAHGSL